MSSYIYAKNFFQSTWYAIISLTVYNSKSSIFNKSVSQVEKKIK